MEPIKILIADDEEFYAACIKIILEGTNAGQCRVVGLAKDGREAIEKTQKLRPDVVLMDIRMPIVDGVEATRVIHERCPETKVMILTTFDDDDYVVSALDYGAAGYVLKTIEASELLASVNAVFHGTYPISPTVVSKLLHGGSEGQGSGEPSDTGTRPCGNRLCSMFPGLSRREGEVLSLLLKDLDNSEIADRMCVAEQTVRNYVSLIYAKIGVRDRNHAKRHVRERMWRDQRK